MGKVKCKRAMRRVANIVTMIANDKEEGGAVYGRKVGSTHDQRAAKKGARKAKIRQIDKEAVALLKATKKAIIAKAKLSATKVNKNKKLNRDLAKLRSANAKSNQAYIVEKEEKAA